MSRDTPCIGFGTRRIPSTAALLHSARYSGGFAHLSENPRGIGAQALSVYGLNPAIFIYISAMGRLRSHQETPIAEQSASYTSEEGIACDA